MSDSGHTYESDGSLQVRSREKENRDSDVSTVTVVPATIVNASIARTARGNIVASPVRPTGEGPPSSRPASATPTDTIGEDISRRSPSPVSLVSSSESSASTTAFGSGSASGSAYAKGSPAPSPRVETFASAEQEKDAIKERPTSGFPSLDFALDVDIDLDILRRPSILIDDIIATGALSEGTFIHSARPSPTSPIAPRYQGWVSEVVAPLSEFIDATNDPRSLFGDLHEIGEGESGSVYAAKVLNPKKQSRQDADVLGAHDIAIKSVPLVPGSPKLVNLQRELRLTRGMRHRNVLNMEDLFVDTLEDALWIKMELMERSLADMLLLVEEGIVLGEKPIASFASDMLHGLSYLQKLGIAHRDLRSDNVLINSAGVAKIADFANAVQVKREEPSRTDLVGVIYWQAPEVRTPPYNTLKVDVWSLGATVWEMAQAEPPFSEIQDPRLIPHRWPSLRQPEIYSRSFHDFLHLCSQPSSLRPDPDELLKTPFIRNASGRPAILKLLSDCRDIEGAVSRRQSSGSSGTVSVS
ncbi:kinase-like protein [Fomitopsis betulina]|nr:kinase-like protein [Fomitopsis betulina]